MTVLSALQSAAIRLNGTRPASVFASTDQFEMELAALSNEVAQDIAKSHDWQALYRIATLTGDGTTTDFSLPSDYDRMPINADFLDMTTFGWGYTRIKDVNEWLLLTRDNYTVNPGAWILFGNLLQFIPAPASGTTKFPYISANIAQSVAQAPKAEFDTDTDTFVLPERLLTLGVIWRWREMKKLDASTEQASFEKAFNEYAGRDKGARILFEGLKRTPGAITTAYPYSLGA